MRPVSNLKSNPEFQIKKSRMRQSFLALYYARAGINQLELMFRMTMAALYEHADLQGSVQARKLKLFADVSLIDEAHKVTVRSSLTYDAPTQSFEYRTPIFRAHAIGDEVPTPDSLRLLISDLAQENKINPDTLLDVRNTLAQTKMGNGRLVSGAELSVGMKVPQHTKEVITEAVKHLECTRQGTFLILWATFRIDKEEAEYLNNTSINEIKLSNFYPTLLDWASTGMGFTTRLPKTITPITVISSSVKEVLVNTPVEPRVGVDNMVMDNQDNIFVIPEVDNAQDYEQKLMDFGLQDNGSYSWARKFLTDAEDNANPNPLGLNVNDPQARVRLPVNMPIYTDWLNDKFAYSNTSGKLSIYDLSNTVPVTNFHLLKVLNSPVSLDVEGLMHIVYNAVTTVARYQPTLLDSRPTAAEIAELQTKTGIVIAPDKLNSIFGRPALNFKLLLQKAIDFHVAAVGTTEDFYVVNGRVQPRGYQLNATNGLTTLRFIGRVLEKTLSTIEENLESMYKHYSVLTVLQFLAVLRVLAKHSGRHAEITVADTEERDPYLNQGVDPNYKVEPIALIKNDLGFMPHQAKCDNKMRKHPKSAIYGVSAGGGKTILILTNILREIKAGVCKRPLVMCPPHLVAQYIEEVVYVTEGRLNIIPITNITLKSHGAESLLNLVRNAPPNTVCITDYDFVTRNSEDVAYGNKSLTIYRNAELLRSLEFDLVALDESHFLKNATSNRRDAAARLIQDIPYKRLASGTFVSDTIRDVVSQIGLIDPTIFGSDERFKREFAADVKGSKVMSWRDGAEKEVRERINDHVVYAEAKRKEWAALLPEPEEVFHGVELTENQRVLYASILEETTKMIEEALARRPDIKDAMESEDDTKAEDLERMLRPYMARLEKFLSSPDQDPAGALFLKMPEDKISPKLKKMYEIIQHHLDSGLPGKVLVFTQYLPTAESAYLNAPPALRAQGIHYTSDEKVQARSDFEASADKRWMVGQSSSMDTGLNFQHVSRLIRLETVWTPGVLEQGNSRINRPQMKTAEERTKIYFDWILVNQTVDITKCARLIAKLISKAKFDEYDNPAYQEIDNLDPVPITMESIRSNNNFDIELQPYLLGYQQYDDVLKEDYKEYRRVNGLNTPEDIQKAKVAIPQGGMLEGSKLISRVPYVPGMNIYGAADLGLLRYDQFVRQDIDTIDDSEVQNDDNDDEDDIDEVEDANDPKAAVRRALKESRAKERVLARNRPCHTEYGDGEITAIGNKFVRVRLNDGRRVRLEKLKVFVITRGSTNNKDMRNELLKMVGEIPFDAPITVPAEEGPALKAKKAGKANKEVVEDNTPNVDLHFTIINDMLFIKYSASEHDKALPILQNQGFRVSPPYKFSRMLKHTVLIRLFRAWKEQGFKVDKNTSTQFMHVFELFKTKGRAGLSKFGFATQQAFKDFYREEIKPSASQTDLKVYPMIQDGELYVVLPTAGQTANLKAVRVPVMNVRWNVGGGKDEVLRGCKTKEEAKAVIKKLIDNGVRVNNLADLGKHYKSIRMGTK